ncbi:hypothetical protein SESBI_46069 [Sesbania bispinosa]|nr:hypothetical protein SESBI_46069 [Sesbania bispinosa]
MQSRRRTTAMVMSHRRATVRLPSYRRRSVTVAFPSRATVTATFFHSIATSICMGTNGTVLVIIGELHGGACDIRQEKDRSVGGTEEDNIVNLRWEELRKKIISLQWAVVSGCVGKESHGTGEGEGDEP